MMESTTNELIITSQNHSISSESIISSIDRGIIRSGNGHRESIFEKYSQLCIIIVFVFFVIGALGNFLALVILAKKKNAKNSKYTLMLRCLASNNLIGLMGMLTQLILRITLPMATQKSYIRLTCAGMVVWRFFGLSSGCIAAVMAAERWMALARPFTYHKHITYNVVKKCINYLVIIATIITFMPLIGFGVYFDSENKKCLRYRDATSLTDIAYAYVFMIFGTFLCIVIVGCNFFVTRVLCFIGRSKTRRKFMNYEFVSVEKGSSSNGGGLTSNHHQNNNSLTTTTSSDEIRFAKLMTFLSISFVFCWMPQMISIPLALMPNPLPKRHWFFSIADVLMALHFTSDPYVYVLSRTKSSFILNCIKRWRSGIQRTQSVQSSRLRPTMEQTMDYGLNT